MRSPRRTWCGSPAITGQDAWRDQVDRLFDGLLPLAADNLFMHVALLNALDLRLRGAEIVVAGTGERAAALVAAALKLPFLDRVVIRAPCDGRAAAVASGAPTSSPPSTEPAAFICAGETCSLPVTTPEQIAATMMSMRAAPQTERCNAIALLKRFKNTAARLQLCVRAASLITLSGARVEEGRR